MMMNSFMPVQILQPVKPVVFVVLDTRKQTENGAAKAPSETSSFGGYANFKFKRTGEKLGNDLMGRQKNPAAKMEQKETPKDKTPAKTEETAKKPVNVEKEKRSHEENQDDNFGRGILNGFLGC